MAMKVDHVSSDEKWAMATKGLIGALAAHLNLIHHIVGKEKYAQIIHQTWADIGQATAQGMIASGVEADSVESVAAAGVTSCICAMGPEYQIEQASTSKDKTVMKVTRCPWQNRMKESSITHDLLTACDIAFWHHFTETLNPNVKMRHGKQMHRGDSYCEWIFEAKEKGN